MTTGLRDSPVTLEKDGNTLLTGMISDQAALLGLIKKVRDLGLTLISVSPVEPGPAATPGTGQDQIVNWRGQLAYDKINWKKEIMDGWFIKAGFETAIDPGQLRPI